MKIVIDLEADGLLMDATQVWCVAIQNLTDGTIDTLRPSDEDFVDSLNDYFADAEEIIGHNIMMYDLPLLNRLYGITYDSLKVVDTQLISRVLEPDRDRGHSLKAWGERLGVVKSDFTDFSKYTEEMLEYCIQDVRVTFSLYKRLSRDTDLGQRFIRLEHDFAYIISQQVIAGFNFDSAKAEELYTVLNDEYITIREELTKLMPSIKDLSHYNTVVKKGMLISENAEGYTYTAAKKVKTKDFVWIIPNPTSRQQLATWLTAEGWKPKSFTETGLPEVNEKTLMDFATPGAKKAACMLRLQKQLGMLKDGKSGWLKCINPVTKRIHGDIITNGANTGRCTHSKPNVGQVDRKDYRMRELWIPKDGWKLVGIDAASLELRILGHYLSFYDKGSFAYAVEKEDIHTYNQEVFKLDKRDSAKTMIYALVYGAGDRKLGSIEVSDKGITKPTEEILMKSGRHLRNKVVDDFTGYKELLEDVKKMFKYRGFLVGLDGRPLHPRKEYSALNLLIQSGGAIVMKQALVNSYKMFKEAGYILGVDYNYVGNVHDEAQIECRPDIADSIGNLFISAIETTTTDLNLRCKMSGESKVGYNWSETH